MVSQENYIIVRPLGTGTRESLAKIVLVSSFWGSSRGTLMRSVLPSRPVVRHVDSEVRKCAKLAEGVDVISFFTLALP